MPGLSGDEEPDSNTEEQYTHVPGVCHDGRGPDEGGRTAASKGLRVEGLGLRVEGLGFRVEGLGFRV